MSATHVRYRVVAFMVSLAGITYLDRICISTLAPMISQDLGLTKLQMSFVFSAFTVAYALFEIPTAAWADRIGSRKVLTRIVLWWSAFTMATAGAFNYAIMLVVRFLFGAGEAGAWPNAARVHSRWVPAHERGRVQGIFFAGAFLIGGLTPSLVQFLGNHMHWRQVFLTCGVVGFGWAVLFYWWFRDEPREHSAVSPEEASYIESTRGLPPAHAHGGGWTQAFRTPGVAALCLQYVGNAYGSYFFMTWLPTYLIEARGMGKTELSIFAGLPLGLSVFAALTGGVLTDFVSKKFGVHAGRSGVGAIGYLLATVAMLGGALVSDPRLSGFLIAIGGASSMFTLAPAWATAIEMGGRNSAVLSATMNTAGQVGAFFSPIVVGYIVQQYGNWSMPLVILAGLYFIAAICWMFFIRPATPELAQKASS